jgi:hypothetical protein
MDKSTFEKLFKALEAEEEDESEQESAAAPAVTPRLEPAAERRPIKRKSVSFDLPPEPEAPIPSTSQDSISAPKKQPQPFKDPVKGTVFERPFRQPEPRAVATKAEAAPKSPRQQQEKDIPSDEEDEEEESDYEDLVDLSSDDDDVTNIDELLLHRELAMEYHRKRFDMLPGLNPEYQGVSPF